MMVDEKDIYSFFREEIEREDEITHNRMITSLTFQGFLLGAMGFLLSGAWPTDHPDIVAFREWVVGGIGVIGFLMSVSSAIGIQATRMSISDTKYMFHLQKDGKSKDVKEINEKMKLILDPRLPKVHGRGIAFFMGDVYARSVPFSFSILWASYLVLFSYYIKCELYDYAKWCVPLTFVAFCIALILLNVRSNMQRRKKVETLNAHLETVRP